MWNIRSIRLSLALLAGLQSAAALAHEGHAPRGVVLEERVIVRPANGYNPPAPRTLGGSFEMMDHTGRMVTDQTYRGAWMLVFFGYTGCREACPTGLVNLTEALNAMGPDADGIQPVFVDFSMEEPDVRGLAEFVGNFHPRLIGLTGTRAQTFNIVRQYKVRREYGMMNYSGKETGPRINHTTYFYLVDPHGVTRSYFQHDLPADAIVSAMRLQLRQAQDRAEARP